MRDEQNALRQKTAEEIGLKEAKAAEQEVQTEMEDLKTQLSVQLPVDPESSTELQAQRTSRMSWRLEQT